MGNFSMKNRCTQIGKTDHPDRVHPAHRNLFGIAIGVSMLVIAGMLWAFIKVFEVPI